MLTVRMNKVVKTGIAVILVLVAVKVFVDFSPLTYGSSMTKEHCQGIKWRSKWDWGCDHGPRAVKENARPLDAFEIESIVKYH